MRPIVLVVFSVLVLGSCSGKIVTKYCGSTVQDCKFQNANGETTSTTEKGQGVPFRMTESRMEYFTYTTHPTQQTCTFPLRNRIVENVPGDWYTIAYKPAPFEQHKFSVTLNPNGTLSSVNAESTPVTPEALVKAAVAGFTGAGIIGKLLPSGAPCTDTLVILGRCKIKKPATATEPEMATVECHQEMEKRLNKYKKPASQESRKPVEKLREKTEKLRHKIQVHQLEQQLKELKQPSQETTKE